MMTMIMMMTVLLHLQWMQAAMPLELLLAPVDVGAAAS